MSTLTAPASSDPPKLPFPKTTCRGCHAQIFFARHAETLSMMPFDLEPCESRWRVEQKGWWPVRFGERSARPLLVATHLKEPIPHGYVSHFGTCPARSQFSRKGGGKGEGTPA